MAEKKESHTQHASRGREIVLLLCCWSVGPILAAAVGFACAAGGDAEPVLFATLAQIAPVLGLAAFVEITLVMTPVIRDQGATPGNTATARVLVLGNAGLLIESAGFALYATASDRQSTFLILACVIPLLLQVLLIADTAYLRSGVTRLRGG